MDLPSEFSFLFNIPAVFSHLIFDPLKFKVRAQSLLMCFVFLQRSAEDQPNEQEEGCWQSGTLTTLSSASATGYFTFHTFWDMTPDGTHPLSSLTSEHHTFPRAFILLPLNSV